MVRLRLSLRCEEQGQGGEEDKNGAEYAGHPDQAAPLACPVFSGGSLLSGHTLFPFQRYSAFGP